MKNWLVIKMLHIVVLRMKAVCPCSSPGKYFCSFSFKRHLENYPHHIATDTFLAEVLPFPLKSPSCVFCFFLTAFSVMGSEDSVKLVFGTLVVPFKCRQGRENNVKILAFFVSIYLMAGIQHVQFEPNPTTVTYYGKK
jgi:hypothetical protein